MDCTVGSLVKLVILVRNLMRKLLWLVRFLQLLTNLTVVFNCLLNELIDTQIEHIVLNCKV